MQLVYVTRKVKQKTMLRKAEEKDIARIAEIIVFTKRHTYRDIFKNDEVSFNVIQVLSEADSFKKPHALDNMYVYDDGIVKAMINAEITNDKITISDFYVDKFFQNEGIGTYVMNEFIKMGKKIYFWVLDRNTPAREFYEKLGFKLTGVKQEFENSGFYILQYSL